MITEIRGVVATTKGDFQGDKLTLACIRDLAKQLKKIELFCDHKLNYSYPVGKPTGMDLSKKGLEVNFVLDPERQKYHQVIAAVCRGVFTGFSINILPEICGMKRGKTRVFSKVKLREISLVKQPANKYCVFDKDSVNALRKLEKKMLKEAV